MVAMLITTAFACAIVAFLAVSRWRTRPLVTESFDSAAGKKVVLVHAEWCGHCKELLEDGGVWAGVKKRLPGITVEEADEASNPQIVKALDVRSFPSIHITEGGKSVAVFQGSRTEDALVQFVMKHIKQA